MTKKEKYTYINDRGESVSLGTDSFYKLLSPGEMGSAENDIFSTETMEGDGEVFSSQTLKTKHVELTGEIVTNSRESLYESRRNLIKVFNPKLPVGTLIYENEFSTYAIKVYIEIAPSFPHDDRETRQKFIVNLRALDPYWHNVKDSETDLISWINNWEFDWNIENDYFEFEYNDSNKIVNLSNEGDAAIGAVFTLQASGLVKNPSILNVETSERLTINTIMTAGDEIRIFTLKGNKKIEKRSKGSEWERCFQLLAFGSVFLQLEVGDNYFKAEAEENQDNVTCLVSYNVNYVGV